MADTGVSKVVVGKNRFISWLEVRLGWWNELSAGVGLLVGYLLYGLYWLGTPETIVEVETQRVVMEALVIGHIPESKKAPYLLTEAPEATKPVRWSTPKMSDLGVPLIETYSVQFSGRGKPVVTVNQVEVLMPRLAPTPYYVIPENQGGDVYQPIVIQAGSGFYITEKTVAFEGELSPDAFAIRVAAGFAALALILFILKSRFRIRQAWIDLKESRLESESYDD